MIRLMLIVISGAAVFAVASGAFAQPKMGWTKQPVLSNQVAISNPYNVWGYAYLSKNGRQWNYAQLKPKSNDAYHGMHHMYFWDGHTWRYVRLTLGKRYQLTYYNGHFHMVLRS